MDVAAHKPAGKWYNMHLNMSGEMHMLRRSHAVMMRYSAAYPTGRERGDECFWGWSMVFIIAI